MTTLVYVLHHATDDPDRAATGLHAAAEAARAGHDVALWLAGEGCRLGVEGVAETLREPLPERAEASIAGVVEAGGTLYVDRVSFTRREYEEDALRKGATLAEPARLAALLADGARAVTM